MCFISNLLNLFGSINTVLSICYTIELFTPSQTMHLPEYKINYDPITTDRD